ncbi:MAG: hypothetical protein ACREBG_18825 [Pyrinomonadaceae bacterium]
MQITDTKNPSERRKLIWALLLGLIAIVFLWWTFFGFGGSSKPTNGRNAGNPAQPPGSRRAAGSQLPRPEDLKNSPVEQLRPIIYSDYLPAVGEAQRNIFVYEKPKPVPVASVPTPTPTPTPPVLLATVSPASVYARTDDFTLDVTGDKFTNEVRITVDGRDLPTRFMSPQQLSATVPASVIANAGSRQVAVRSADGRLYSNVAVLNVNAPPTPNYSYIGIIGTQRRMDTAILQDKSNKEIINAQRGDVLGGRFRLTSISEKELVLVDTNLRIKHMLPFTTDRDKGLGPLGRPTPRVDSEDDEP